MNTILKVIKQQEFDRNVFITYSNNEIVGLNFHQGVGEILHDYSTPCPALTDIFYRVTDSNSSLSLEDRINKAIGLFCDAFIHQKNSTYIPLHQRKLIQKALDFYILCSEKLNKDPNEEENFALFDMMQLSAMMNYDLISCLSDDEHESFDIKHGVHFPEYITS